MPTFEQGDIVRVPFPYTDRSTRQFRPALVISRRALGEAGALLWVVMITSAENRAWVDDVPITGLPQRTGLSSSSVVRSCKIATIDARHAEKIGDVDPELLDRVLKLVMRYI